MYIVVSGRGASAEIEASLNNLCAKAGGYALCAPR